MNLPNALIIGAQKGGTSSLHYYLSQHPDVSVSSKKEVHFFDGGHTPRVDTYAKGLGWYAAFFPESEARIRLESTPSYLFDPLAPARIKNDLPDVRLIALLRNPIDRAISQYFHNLRKPGREPLSLADALNQEEARLRGADLRSTAFRHYSYQARGRYAEQLRRYFDLFDRRRLLILQSERFFRNPAEQLERVYDFLGLAQAAGPDLTPRNASNNTEAATPDIVALLRSSFAPLNDELFDLLGQRFDW